MLLFSNVKNEKDFSELINNFEKRHMVSSKTDNINMVRRFTYPYHRKRITEEFVVLCFL